MNPKDDQSQKKSKLDQIRELRERNYEMAKAKSDAINKKQAAKKKKKRRGQPR